MNAVEIGDRAGGFRSRRRSEFIGDRSDQTIFRSVATPAATATASATARAPFAVRGLIVVRHAGLFVGFILLGFAVNGDRAFDRLGGDAHGIVVRARCAAFTRFTGTAAPAATALALLAIRFGFADDFTAGSLFDQSFGFLGFDFGFVWAPESVPELASELVSELGQQKQ